MALFNQGEPVPTSNTRLVPCMECQGAVSKKTEVCPHCGARIKQGRTGELATIIFVLGILYVIGEIISNITRSR